MQSGFGYKSQENSDKHDRKHLSNNEGGRVRGRDVVWVVKEMRYFAFPVSKSGKN